MVIISFAEPAAIEFAAAIAAGFAVEMRPGQPMRLISNGEHAVELDQLQDRVLESLEHGKGPGRHPDAIPGPQHFSGQLSQTGENSTCRSSEPCTSATISPDGTIHGSLPPLKTA